MPEAAADLHLHLLPGLDDGSPDLDTAVAHARRMVRGGVRDAACTPHVKHHFPGVDVTAIAGLTAALQDELDLAGVPLRLHPSGELDWERAAELSLDELDLLALGPPEARWLLVESPFAGFLDGFVALVAELQVAGFGVLLAHPERALGALEPGSALPLLEDAGCLLQVSTDTLAGEQGASARRAAWSLLPGGRAAVLASDGHPGSREGILTTTARAAGVDEGTLAALAVDAPRHLLREGLRPGARPLRAPLTAR